MTEASSDFRSSYELMSDGELLRLAAERSDLVDEAIVALDSELVKRSLPMKKAADFKRNFERQNARDIVGSVGISWRNGIGKQFLGMSNYSPDSMKRSEDFESTLWFFVFWLPVLPISGVRIRRELSGKSIFWSYGNSNFQVIETTNLNFIPVITTYTLSMSLALCVGMLLRSYLYSR